MSRISRHAWCCPHSAVLVSRRPEIVTPHMHTCSFESRRCSSRVAARLFFACLLARGLILRGWLLCHAKPTPPLGSGLINLGPRFSGRCPSRGSRVAALRNVRLNFASTALDAPSRARGSRETHSSCAAALRFRPRLASSGNTFPLRYAAWRANASYASAFVRMSATIRSVRT